MEFTPLLCGVDSMTIKRLNITLIIPNYTIAGYVARFEYEHPGVKTINTVTITFPDALTYNAFTFELGKMAMIQSQPNRLVTLS